MPWAIKNVNLLEIYAINLIYIIIIDATLMAVKPEADVRTVS